MTIQESNKLIAEFMGGEVREVWRVNDSITYMWCGQAVSQWRKEKMGIYIGDGILLNQLEFHSSWNWLIPVVEKIESIYDEHNGYFGVHISGNSCVIQGTNLHKAIEDLQRYGTVYCSDPLAVFPTKLESTYHAVVEFIKWYNNNEIPRSHS